MRTDRITIAAWATNKQDCDHACGVLVKGAIPNNGIRDWLASALSMATAASPTSSTASHPNTQPIFGLASRDAH